MALGDGKSSEPENSLRSRLLLQQQAFLAEGPPSAAVRRHRIDRLVALLFENADALAQAMLADYGSRSPVASVMTEIVGIGSTIEYTRNNLERWMRPRRTLPGYRLFGGVSAEVEPSPKGVVGIIGPWNFPVNLVALPAVEAFAAGNRVMIKMSEVTSHTAEVFADLAARYFDPSELDVVVGPIEVGGAQFAALPFDHLFFTGSPPSVGRLIQRAASEHLVPVTLELGGKNPVVVAQNADIDRYAGRIANARLVNGGQVCLCPPDYVFVPPPSASRNSVRRRAQQFVEYCRLSSTRPTSRRQSTTRTTNGCWVCLRTPGRRERTSSRSLHPEKRCRTGRPAKKSPPRLW